MALLERDTITLGRALLKVSTSIPSARLKFVRSGEGKPHESVFHREKNTPWHGRSANFKGTRGKEGKLRALFMVNERSRPVEMEIWMMAGRINGSWNCNFQMCGCGGGWSIIILRD